MIEQININIKYEGYIKRQLQQVEQFKKMENKLIPDTINYDEVHNLRNEAVQKLKAVHPHFCWTGISNFRSFSIRYFCTDDLYGADET